jgi:hypothetical protein
MNGPSLFVSTSVYLVNVMMTEQVGPRPKSPDYSQAAS